MKKVVMILICLAFCAYAQWSSDPATNLELGARNYPVIAPDGSGGVIAAFRSSGFMIYVVRLDSDGYELWREEVYPPTPSGGYIEFDLGGPHNICSDLSGNYFISFDVGGDDGSYYDYRPGAIKITESGSLPWGSNVKCINSSPSEDLDVPVLVEPDGSGGCYLSWFDAIGSNDVLKAGRISSTGSESWSNTMSNTSRYAGPASNQVNKAFMASDRNGNCYVVWYEDNVSGSDNRVFARRLGTSGPAWSAVMLSGHDTQYARCAIEGTSLIVIFPDDDYEPELTYAQKINTSGSLQWGTNGKQVFSPPYEDDTRQGVVGDGSGGCIVIARDNRGEATTSEDLYAMRLNSSGTRLWTPADGVRITNTPTQEIAYEIISDGSGGAVFAHRQNGVNGYATRISSSGTIEWTTQYTTRGTNADAREMCRTSDGGYVLLFDTGGFVYAQKINADGTLAGEGGGGDPDISFELIIDGYILLGELTPVTFKFKNNGGDSEPETYSVQFYGSIILDGGGIYPDGPWSYIHSIMDLELPAISAGDSVLISENCAWANHDVYEIDDPPVWRTNYIKANICEHGLGPIVWSDSTGAYTEFGDELRSEVIFWCFDLLMLSFGPGIITNALNAGINIFEMGSNIANCLEDGDWICAGTEFATGIISISDSSAGEFSPLELVNLITRGTWFWNYIYTGYLSVQPWRIFDFLGAVWDFITGGSRSISYYSAGLATVEASRSGENVRTLMLGNETAPSYGWYMDLEIWTGPDSCIFADWIDSLGNYKRLILGNEKNHIYIITEGSPAYLSVWGDAGVGAECVLDTNISPSTTDTIPFGAPVGIKNREPKKPNSLFVEINPNPFNSSVSISAPENATVEIFDVNGRAVATLEGGEQVWRPEPSVGSGIYLVRATVGDKEVTKRVVYLK